MAVITNRYRQLLVLDYELRSTSNVYNTSSSAIAERPRDASIREIIKTAFLS